MNNPSADSNRYWYALYTKPRHEFKAESFLTGLGFKYYLPCITRLKQWSDRKKKVTEPLFRGYIFLYVNEKERWDALQSESIISTVSWGGKPERIPPVQIESLKRILENKSEVFVENKIEKGTKVKIIDGPFRDVEGIVFKNANQENMLAVTVELLKRSVIVHLPANSVTEKK